MNTINQHLNNAMSIIRDTIARCESSGTDGTKLPRPEPRYGGDSGSPREATPNPRDLPGGNSVPEIPKPKLAVTSEESWSIEGSAFGGVKIAGTEIGIGGDSSVEITQMSDGSYQIKAFASGNVSTGIAGNGVEGGYGGAVTYSVTAEELAYLKEQGLPIPDGVIPPGTDSSNVNVNPLNNIHGVEVSQYAELALHDFDIPEEVTSAAEDFFNADFPDGVSAAAGGEVSYGARKNQFGEWEIVQKVSVEGSYDTEVHEDSGRVGGFLNNFTPFELNDTTIKGTKVDYTIEHVYNAETGQAEIRVIETKTKLNAEGAQFGVKISGLPGVPFIPDSVPGSEFIPELEHTVSEASKGTTKTVTTETVYDHKGNQVRKNTSSSNGTFFQGEENLVFLGADGQVTHEEHVG